MPASPTIPSLRPRPPGPHVPTNREDAPLSGALLPLRLSAREVVDGFLSEPHDLDRLSSGVALIRALAEQAGCGRELRPGDHDSLDRYLRREVRGIFHPTGTCAIGAVVDTRGVVLGVDGLLVADASIMPTIPRANTNLSTIAVAERIADWLRA